MVGHFLHVKETTNEPVLSEGSDEWRRMRQLGRDVAPMTPEEVELLAPIAPVQHDAWVTPISAFGRLQSNGSGDQFD